MNRQESPPAFFCRSDISTNFRGDKAAEVVDTNFSDHIGEVLLLLSPAAIVHQRIADMPCSPLSLLQLQHLFLNISVYHAYSENFICDL